MTTKPPGPLFEAREISSTDAMGMPLSRPTDDVQPVWIVRDDDERMIAHGGVWLLGDHGDASAAPFEHEPPAPAPKKRRAASPRKAKATKPPRATKRKA